MEGLCSACLLTLGLRGAGEEPEPDAATRTPGRERARGELRPLGAGSLAPLLAMPVELLRQAARRLRVAAFGVGLAFPVTIVLNNLVEGLGWYHFGHPALKNVVAAVMVAVSAGVA